MDARMLCVVGAAAARLEIDCIAVKRFGDGQRAAFVYGVAGLTARERPRLIDRLPIGQHRAAVGALKIVGERDALHPLGAAVGDADRPRSAALVSAVAEVDAGADRRPVRFLAYGEAAAGSWGFKLGGARLRHGFVSVECP